MSFRAWVFIATLGIAFASVANAQGSEEQPIDQNTEGQGQQPSEAKPTPPGFPIRILEEPEQSEGAKREQQEASQREIDDLQAQNLAAESAQGAYRVGIAQTALAFFGTLALIYSLYLNRRATNAAVDAVKVSERTGVAQVRAYVGFGTSEIRFTGGPITTDIIFKNFGQSAARNTKICVRWYYGHEFCEAFEAREEHYQWVGALAPGQQSIAAIDTARSDDAAVEGAKVIDSSGVLQGHIKFWVFGEVRYKDDFGASHRTTFRVQLAAVLPISHFILCADGNDMT